MEKGLSKNQMIGELTRSPHGDLKQYIPVGSRAAQEDPEFFAHLIAWNEKNGQIRDSKVALPLLALSYGRYANADAAREFRDNALAHLALLDPRNLLRAFEFAPEAHMAFRPLRKLGESYVRAREENWAWWERTALQHRASMKTLYSVCHLKPKALADQILFKDQPPAGTAFAAVKALKKLTPVEAGSAIIEHRIPFLVAKGALGERMKDPDILVAILERISPTELVTNTKELEKLGARTNPAVRGAFESALGRAAEAKKATLKATRAAEAQTDPGMKAKLLGLQERQIDALGAVEGNWLVLGDKSGSMEIAISTALEVAAILARVVKGNVHLIFFDVSPRYINATKKTYEELRNETRHVTANGGTSIGCGLAYCLEGNIEVDGVAIVSDSAENTPPTFAHTYKRYCAAYSKEPPVYLYKTVGEATQALERDMNANGLELQVFDIRGGIDYASLPNLVATMRANRYSLVDQIMATPLLTLEGVLKKKDVAAIVP